MTSSLYGEKTMKKYLTEKTVALGLAALLACGVALGASLSSDERGNVSPIATTSLSATAVCPCKACDCDDCACVGAPGSPCECADCPAATAKTPCSCGCDKR